MPTQITLNTELSRERLLALRDEIDALLGDAPVAVGNTPAATETAAAGTSQDGAAMQAAARRLLGRLGPRLQGFVRFTVEQFDGRTFTWDDVASEIEEEIGTVKSWHRSLSKPMGRLMDEMPGVPAVIKGIGYDGRSHYEIGPGWKDAIESTWGDAGKS